MFFDYEPISTLQLQRTAIRAVTMFSEGEVKERRYEEWQCALWVVDLAALTTEPAVIRLTTNAHRHIALNTRHILTAYSQYIARPFNGTSPYLHVLLMARPRTYTSL